MPTVLVKTESGRGTTDSDVLSASRSGRRLTVGRISMQPALIAIIACMAGCGTLTPQGALTVRQGAFADSPPRSPGTVGEKVFVRATGTITSSRQRRPVGFFIRRQRVAQESLDISSATPAPYPDIIMQPGDSCGATTPNAANSCFATTYAGQGIDSSCGTISWSYDTSDLPAGVLLVAAPTNTAVNGIVYEYLSVAETVPVGNYTYSATGTCSNSNYSGNEPAPGTFSLSIVNVSIVDQTRASPVATLNATPGPIVDVVGDQQMLVAQASPSAAQSLMSSPTWTIPYSGDDPTVAYVSGYVRSKTSATVDAAVNLNANPLAFFPIAAASGQLTFSASSFAAGTAFHATSNYTIVSPAVSVSATYGAVNQGTCMCAAPGSVEQVLVAGPVIENAPASPVPGVSWTATFSATSPLVAGVGGMTQLANEFLYTQPSPAPGATYAPGVYGGTNNAFESDSGATYPQSLLSAVPTVPVTVTPTVWSGISSPFFQLYSCSDFSQFDASFEDYFTFKQVPKPGYSSIPVTLSKMEWQFGTYSFRNDGLLTGGWVGALNYDPLSGSPAAQTTELPVWSANLQATRANQGNPCLAAPALPQTGSAFATGRPIRLPGR